MSQVTNVILTTASMEGLKYLDLVTELHRLEILTPVRVDQYGALGKVMEAHVYVGAYNYLRLDDFVEAVDGVAWLRPEAVRLFIKEDGDEQGFHEVALPNCDAKRWGRSR